MTAPARRSLRGRRSVAVLTGLVVALVIDIVLAALQLFVDWPSNSWLIAIVVTAVLPLAFGLGLPVQVRQRPERVLAALVAAAVLGAFVVVVFVIVVVGFYRAPHHSERVIVLLTMLAGVLVAVMWQPARARSSAWSRRLMRAEPQSAQTPLALFGERLSRAIPMDELMLQLAESLQQFLELRSVEIWSGTAERLRRTVSIPHRDQDEITLTPDEASVIARAGVAGGSWAAIWLPTVIAGREDAALRIVPLAHSEKLLGLIVIEFDPDRAPGDETGENELSELARRTALALHNVQLDSALQASLEDVRAQARELRESRNRVVLAGDAERRRLERDLHDGAQQRLVGLNIKLDIARRFLQQAPEKAAGLLDELGGELHEALDELRDLAHGIYPPLLRDRGLPTALATAASRSSLPAVLAADGIGRFDPDVESAVYFCCLEALQNAAKYAGDGASARIRVWEEAGALLFEVSDDGQGFDQEKMSKGAGLMNMEDRVGALGGSIHIESSPLSGTRLQGRMPLTRQAPE
jgi:signal transduction histidine kinase